MKKIISGFLCALIFSSYALASDGLISFESNYTVNETADRFESILENKGFTIFQRIDHSKNASTVNLELPPTQVIIFGNPKGGTLLMQCSKTVAIDLPQKVLLWQDEKGQVFLSYTDPEYLKKRHAIIGCDKVINKISGVLGNLSKQATAK